MLEQVKGAIDLIGDIANATGQQTNPTTSALVEALFITDYDAPSRFQRLATLLYAPEVVRFIQQSTHDFEDRFFDQVLPTAIVELRQIAELIRSGQTDVANSKLATLSKSIDDASGLHGMLRQLGRTLLGLADDLSRLTYVPQDGSSEQTRAVLTSTQDIVHDTANILTDIEGALYMAKKDPNRFVKFIGDRFKRYDTTSVAALLSTVVNLTSYAASRKGVAVTASPFERAQSIPLPQQRDLFRVLFEAVYNGIKYSDAEKSERTVHLSVSEEGNVLVFRVKDNGVGMSSDDAERVQKEPGLRLKPELAPGTGNGITETIAIAMRHGWEVNYRPTPGEGLEVTVRIDTGGWPKADGPPGGPASPAAAGSGTAPTGRTPSGTASASAAGRHLFGGSVSYAAGSTPAGRPSDTADDEGGDGSSPSRALWGTPPLTTNPAAAGVGVFAAPVPAFAR